MGEDNGVENSSRHGLRTMHAFYKNLDKNATSVLSTMSTFYLNFANGNKWCEKGPPFNFFFIVSRP